ncbi:hypothetical protein [Ornithinimicrobium sp. LYQ103]|uniref:hypothetical protein n=1 Tax=Ornithinimicrobium sp. LYQ103 TaxID=3378796 RepID=UPI0038549ED3
MSDARGRRRHRRVDAPPTNPDADGTDDDGTHLDASDSAGTGTGAGAGAGRAPAEEDVRDAWFRSQRPPHWD